jgi:hypothetical protein
MSGSNGDIRLPWQYVLLGFLGFGAFLAGFAVAMTFNPNTAHDPRSDLLVRMIGVPYLIACAAATPALISGGRRRRRQWAQATGGPDAIEPPRIPVSRGKQMGVAAIALAAGIVMSIHSYAQASQRGGGTYWIYIGLIGIGAAGLILSLIRRDSAGD